MTSACWAVTDRITISCCSLRVVVPGAAVGAPDAAGACVGGGGTGGSRAAEHLHALEEDLDGRALGSGSGDERLVGSSSGSWIDRELLLGQADDRVDVVTGLDDRADAADLVDLGRRSLAVRPGPGHR